HSDHFATDAVFYIGLSYGADTCPVIHGTSLRLYSTSTVLVPLSSMALFPVIHCLWTVLSLYSTSTVLFPMIRSHGTPLRLYSTSTVRSPVSQFSGTS
uniref:Uncharacterized protein n=1 Tax=Anopheles arabiensis TaxID=7173 RepID=A0A182IHQ6_ANOAR